MLTIGSPPATGPEGLELAFETVRRLYAHFLAALPLVGLAVVVGVVGVVLAFVLAAGVQRAIARTGADAVAVRLLGRIVRLLAVVGALLFALAIAGVPVGAALAGLGLAGLAVAFAFAFAFQGILENFIAGVILLARRPFRAGDQIRTTDHEGTVEEIDLRVTRLIDYDGTLILVPNADVFKAPLINLTRRGSRRTCVLVGVDYRDDHDVARGCSSGRSRRSRVSSRSRRRRCCWPSWGTRAWTSRSTTGPRRR